MRCAPNLNLGSVWEAGKTEISKYSRFVPATSFGSASAAGEFALDQAICRQRGDRRMLSSVFASLGQGRGEGGPTSHTGSVLAPLISLPMVVGSTA